MGLCVFFFLKLELVFFIMTSSCACVCFREEDGEIYSIKARSAKENKYYLTTNRLVVPPEGCGLFLSLEKTSLSSILFLFFLGCEVVPVYFILCISIIFLDVQNCV